MVALIDEAPAGIHRRRLYDEKLVTLMRAHHPALGGELTLDRFLVQQDAPRHIVAQIRPQGIERDARLESVMDDDFHDPRTHIVLSPD
jgi:DNA-binding transcriptional LysR family regulator